jgi:hypothetical protein
VLAIWVRKDEGIAALFQTVDKPILSRKEQLAQKGSDARKQGWQGAELTVCK